MVTKENLHCGHRLRMIDKLIKNPDGLADHELLEVLLYSVLPRQDTNPLAHRLLRTFGSVTALFDASVVELKSVEGVGEKVAAHIILTGTLLKKLESRRDNLESHVWSNYEQNKERFIKLFDEEKQEKAFIVLLNSKFKEILLLPFEYGNEYSTEADVSEIANAFALHKPKYVIVAHNHPSGNPSPSRSDDLTSMKIKLLCDMYGVAFADHIIVAGKKAYSYYRSDRINEINKLVNIDIILDGIKNAANKNEE